jgi:hemerythrin-like domain-containing protein
MTPAIDMLMQEHRVIETVLNALEGCARALDAGRPVERATVAAFADFFANFADRSHHAKEEDRLFVAMIDHGFPRDGGPVGMMLYEHHEGRQHVAALRRIGEGSGPLTADEAREVAAHARSYAPLLSEHILKEDEILYPMAERELPPDELHEMMAAFERADSEGGAPEELRRLRALAAQLVEEFRN